MILQELFNSPTPFKLEQNTKDKVLYTFTIDDRAFAAGFFKLQAYPELNDYSFTFFDKTNSFSTEITNKGNAIQVFATVKDILKSFNKTHKPTLIAFSAEEPSRIKLYHRFIKQAEQQGWHIQIKRKESETYFKMMKPDHPEAQTK